MVGGSNPLTPTIQQNHTTNRKKITLVFTRQLDSEGRALIHASVVEQVEQAQTLCFDLSGSDFVASAFLRVCILAVKRLDTDRFELTHLSPAVREVFTMAGLDNHLHIIG